MAATTGGITAARPLALYYSFMNLVKTLCLTRGARPSFNQAHHGMKERLAVGGRELSGARIEAQPSIAGSPASNYDEFFRVVTGASLPAAIHYQVPVLLPQIVPGHRFWAQGAKKVERFIALHDSRFMYDSVTHELWLNFYIIADDLSRLGVTQTRLLNESRLAGRFVSVACAEQFGGRALVCLQQITPHVCAGGYPADHFQSVIAPVRHLLWTTVATVTPYRRYYVYLSPTGDHPFVLPQLLSIYALIFYFGSITRYRPHQYDAIASGTFGPWVQEFINGQPMQFLYLMASEFAGQDVTKPSIL